MELNKEIENYFEDKTLNNKVFAVMLFDTELSLGISQRPNKWINFRNLYYTDGGAALMAYANIRCPASQIIDAKDIHELEVKMTDMINHFKDDKWLEECLYPYL